MTITRKTERRRAIRNTSVVTVVISLLCHVLLIALVVPNWLDKMNEEPLDPPEPEPSLEIEAVYDEVETPRTPDAPKPLPREEPEEVQLSAEISDSASESSMMVAAAKQVEPAPEPEGEEVEEPTEPEANQPPEQAEVEPVPVEEQSPVILKKPKPDARALLTVDASSYERMFADADVRAHQHAEEQRRSDRLFKDFEKNKQGIRTSLRSFGHDVRPGNHTGVNRKSNAFGSYIGMIHRKIHARWANGYLMDLDLQEPAGSPMNDPTLNTKLEFVIRAENGEVEAVNIVSSSGQLRFDAQAVAIAHSTGPHPNPPPELVSPNGRVYVHWNFWRDQRQCGTFGASVFIVSEQGGAPG